MRLTDLPGDARPIAVARMGLGIATILNAVEMFVLLGQIASGKVAMPVIPGAPQPSMTAVYVYVVLAVLAGAAITVGWHASRAAFVSTLLSFLVFFWDQQTYSSHRLLATLLVCYLIFACSDAKWAVRRQERPVPWWPQLLMMTQLSVCYFFAAVSKINGAFIYGGPLANWIWVPFPRWFFLLMAVATIAIEIFLAFGFWFRQSRRLAVILGLLLHGSIVLLMRDQTLPLIAFSLTCLSVYGLFAYRPAVFLDQTAKPSLAPLQTGEPQKGKP
jgi:Vitamin K-dependent gamma-carboxylase